MDNIDFIIDELPIDDSEATRMPYPGAALVTTPQHNNLNSIQGGTINERYHLTKDQWQNLTSATFSNGIKTASINLVTMNVAPISATDTGILGEIRITANSVYVCIATNTWVKASLTTF